MVKKHAALRVCGSCEWIFTTSEGEDGVGCPKCGFGSYGARYVYGDKCYKYAKTQQPWMDSKIERYRQQLLEEINASKVH